MASLGQQSPMLLRPSARGDGYYTARAAVLRQATLGTSDSQVHVAAQQLQPRHPQEPRCPPVAFAPLSVSSRLTAKRDQNEADAELKAASGKAHATDGMEVSVLKWPDQAPHHGLRSSGVVSHGHPSTDSSGNVSGLWVSARVSPSPPLLPHRPPVRLVCKGSSVSQVGCRSPT